MLLLNSPCLFLLRFGFWLLISVFRFSFVFCRQKVRAPSPGDFYFEGSPLLSPLVTSRLLSRHEEVGYGTLGGETPRDWGDVFGPGSEAACGCPPQTSSVEDAAMDPVGAANLGSAPSSSSGLEAGCRLLHSTAKQGRLTRTRAHAHAHAHSREHTHTHARARSASDRSHATPAPVARASPKENHANGAFRLVSANSRVLTAAHRSGRVRCSRAGQGARLPHRRVAPKTSNASGPARRPRTSARSVSGGARLRARL